MDPTPFSHAGGCHCGNLRYTLETALALEALPLRACQCAFCRLHGARSTSDPGGRVVFELRDAALLTRYRFGLRTADFLVCARCGVYVGALMREADGDRAIVNANTLDDAARLTRQARPMDYGGEDEARRRARRRQRWSPASGLPDRYNVAAMSTVLRLTPVEARVIAALSEKSITTPQYYPMTVNAIMLASNQKSCRDPVMQLHEGEVGAALLGLADKGLCARDDAGGRAPKWRQSFQHHLLLQPPAFAVLVTLMLRGAQTQSGLRINAAALGGPADAEGLTRVLADLADRAEPLVLQLPRGHGQKESRYAHTLSGAPEPPAAAPADSTPRGQAPPAAVPTEPPPAHLAGLEERLRALEARVAALEAKGPSP